MNDQAPHLLHVREPDVDPCGAAIDRLEDPVADAEIRAVQTFTGADVQDVRV